MYNIEEVAQAAYRITANELAQFIDEFKVSVRKPFKWSELSKEKKSYWYKQVNQICQLFPQPLDDKKLRERLFKILFPYADIKRASDNEMIDQIFALLQPKPDKNLYKQFPIKKKGKEVQCEPYEPA